MSCPAIGVKSPTGLERTGSFPGVSGASFLGGEQTRGNFQICLLHERNDPQVFVGFQAIPVIIPELFTEKQRDLSGGNMHAAGEDMTLSRFDREACCTSIPSLRSPAMGSRVRKNLQRVEYCPSKFTSTWNLRTRPYLGTRS